jgi:hypothetical protein
MLCEENVVVCSEIRIKHTTPRKNHVEFLNVKSCRKESNREALNVKDKQCIKLVFITKIIKMHNQQNTKYYIVSRVNYSRLRIEGNLT